MIAAMERGARYVVGVDFGTLSGRAVVVRRRRRHRAGHRGARVPPRGPRAAPRGQRSLRPGPAAGLGAAGPPRLRRGAAAGGAGGGPRQRHRPRRRDRHRHRLHGVHRAARARRRHAAVRAARVRRPSARLRQALEAPRRAAPRRSDQRAGRRAGRAVAGARTAGGSPRSGSSPRGCSSSRRTRRSTGAPEHWVEAADWIVWQLTGVYVRNACTAGYKAIYQDGSYPSAEFLAALNPDFAGFVADKVERPIAQLGERVGVADRHRCRVDRAARRDRRVRRERRRPRQRARRQRHRARPDGGDHGHVDVPHHECRRPSPRCRGCAASSRAASCPACGGTRRDRAGSVTSSPGTSTTSSPRRTTTPRRPPASTSTSTSPSSPPACRSAATGWWRSTGTAGTARCSSTTTSPAWSSG